MQIVNSNIIKTNNTKTVANKNNLNFAGKRKVSTFDAVAYTGFGTIAALVGASVINLIIQTTNLTSSSSSENKKEIVIENPLQNPTESQIEWNKNIKVIAAVPQDYAGSSEFTFDERKYCSNFTANCMPIAKKTNSFESSVDYLIKNGYANTYYKGSIHYPVATPRNLDVFNKKDTTKTRFAIIISGETAKTYNIANGYAKKSFSQDCEILKKDLKKEYNLTDENIININMKDFGSGFFASRKAKKSLGNAVDSIVAKMQKSKADLKNIELMIYYSGHGKAKKGLLNKLPWVKKYEGSSSGTWAIGEYKIKESFIKRLLNKNTFLQKVKGILLVNDSCYSGAWIADNKNTGKKIAARAINLIS